MVAACCACKRHRRGLRPAVLATGYWRGGVYLRPAVLATGIEVGWGMLCLLQILEGVWTCCACLMVEACCACYRYWRWLRPVVLATDIKENWGLLCWQHILEVVDACCACYRYWRWLWRAVLATYTDRSLRPAVLATYIGGG